jgi:hypothetical protein
MDYDFSTVDIKRVNYVHVFDKSLQKITKWRYNVESITWDLVEETFTHVILAEPDAVLAYSYTYRNAIN